MSREIEESVFQCPVCHDTLFEDIAGELTVTDHDYGFVYENTDCTGYFCKNGHRVVIALTADDEDE